jgi:hypothetical protein
MSLYKNKFDINIDAKEFVPYKFVPYKFVPYKCKKSSNLRLNVNASEFISILTTPSPSSLPSMVPSSLPSIVPSTLPSPTNVSLASPIELYNIENWWYENKTMFDDSYEDMKKIFGWSKVPIRPILRKGELSKLEVKKERPSKHCKTSLSPIKEVEMSYANIVLRNVLNTIKYQN